MSIELKQAAQQAVDAFDAFGDADDFASLFELTQKMRALRTAIQQAEAQQPATDEPVYQICKKDSHCISSAWIDVEKRAYEDAGMYPEYGRRTLYTHPAPGVPDGVVRDAERYRWLRSLEHCNEAWCLIGSGNANSNLDAAIDAAMLAAK